jgi:hypothetical protein
METVCSSWIPGGLHPLSPTRGPEATTPSSVPAHSLRVLGGRGLDRVGIRRGATPAAGRALSMFGRGVLPVTPKRAQPRTPAVPFISTPNAPRPRRYRCPNPGHPNGRAVARNTAPCGSGPWVRRRASCGRPKRLDPSDRRWQRQWAKRQVISPAWPLRSRLCTNFPGPARQKLPTQTVSYPYYYSPETCWNNVQRSRRFPASSALGPS